MKDKATLRAMMRDRRGALTRGERSRASASMCRRLARHPWFVTARRIGLYYPNDAEIDPTPVVDTESVRIFYLPVLPPRGSRKLWFSPYDTRSRLIADRFGIPEPVSRTRLRAVDLDLLLVPLVAFDRLGGRIGMGGGFYDTSLEFLKRSGRIREIRVIGAAYRFQEVADIPRDSWDVPLHGVITDEKFIPAR
jgi:5-formyltetrahydrofolate cyclo-ligase